MTINQSSLLRRVVARNPAGCFAVLTNVVAFRRALVRSIRTGTFLKKVRRMGVVSLEGTLVDGRNMCIN